MWWYINKQMTKLFLRTKICQRLYGVRVLNQNGKGHDYETFLKYHDNDETVYNSPIYFYNDVGAPCCSLVLKAIAKQEEAKKKNEKKK